MSVVKRGLSQMTDEGVKRAIAFIDETPELLLLNGDIHKDGKM